MKDTELDSADPGPELAQLAKSVRLYRTGISATAAAQHIFIFLTGFALLRARSICPHGDWLPWLKREFPEIGRETTRRYQALAREIESKFPTVGNLKAVKTIGAGVKPEDLDARESAIVDKAMHDVLNGRTITGLYRDLGLVSEPKKAGGPRPHKEYTPAENAIRDGREVEHLVKAIRLPIRLFMDLPAKHRDLCSPVTIKSLLEDLIEASHVCRAMLKA